MDDPAHRILNAKIRQSGIGGGAAQLGVVSAVGGSHEGMVNGPGAGPGGRPK